MSRWDSELEKRLRRRYTPPGADKAAEPEPAEVEAPAEEPEASRDFTAKQRHKDAKSGVALPDGGFPIENEEDLRNAIQAIGRASDPAKAKAHIMARARALGLAKLLPSEWTGNRAYALGDGGFAAEVGGKLILTAPARTLSLADELPQDMREKWERASTANPYFRWIHGRFVEAEQANRNGAFWSTADLQFGEMSVRHGPLNWLHEARHVVGTIADNKLIMPPARQIPQVASYAMTAPMSINNLTNMVSPDNGTTWLPIENATATTANTITISTANATAVQPRPYIAAVSAMWSWIYPHETKVLENASESGQLFYSMECVAKEISCGDDGHLKGCGQSFPYMTAMTAPEQVCEHIRNKSSARRMVDPSFLGGAVIVPPVRPGWGEARAEVMRQAAALCEQVAPADAKASQWELLMASVVGYAQIA